MREIIFRGKRVDNGEFVDGHLYGIWDKKYILWGQTNHVPNGEEVIPKTVGQYTGLKDKNGNKIFEGDKIKLTQGIGTVEWSKTQGRFVIWLPKSNKFVSLLSGTTYEVIGNIHEEEKK